MKRKCFWGVVAILFCSALFWVLRNKGERDSVKLVDVLIETREKDSKTLSVRDDISPTDLDAVDVEIERHGYRPSSEQEREELRTSYLVSRYGANAKLTFHVTDSMGRDVPDADLKVVLGASETSVTKRGKTDVSGIFVAEGKTDSEVVYMVEKDGYYRTQATDWLSRRKGADVKNGKWFPWNPTIRVTLKEKRNPIPMYAKNIELILPRTNETFGFDFKIGDLVAPSGKGEVTDMLFTYTIKPPSAGAQEYHSYLTFEGVNENDGVILLQSDLLSNHTSPSFPSVYEAPMEKYEHHFEMSYRYTAEKIIEAKRMEEDDYLVFRSRTATDDKGQISSAHYGKIYYVQCSGTRKNPDGGLIKMQYYFNPTSNDRNLEFDVNQNLLRNERSWERVIIP